MTATVENVRLWREGNLMKMSAVINGKEIEHSTNLLYQAEGIAMKVLQRGMELLCRHMEEFGDDADPMNPQQFQRISGISVRPAFLVPIDGSA